ncbi:MAG TPA: hydroxyphenylacetyl-CoA thioesterase PaaI [Phenylobacterium sp.]|uniref:hydroxyphenylacetyl-CoA thioesterase PaaI n=1 Tax=Phenylobacterium sp. TaxID=1871053 RepID=UPI002B474D12|nr:hydroxyphenylacetyl-CoA thioesterase PaaI [Phenylobacterium sp.]HKR86850.1 hydroxyphenylacetyl-CoA thioesterase PaaI [Phenylobacterium sp.]HKT54722.1 hydroxyphenylacetyl-CoA thioesterase PaaI [Caulobacteraceae bacterium]
MNERQALQIAQALHARSGATRAWDMEILDAGPGWARVAMTVREDMLNGHRVAHGAMIFALADTAFAYACNSRNVSTLAQQASIAFLAPAQPGERLIAEARELMSVGRSGSYAVTVATEDGRPIASFTGLSRTIGGAVITSEE